MGAMGLVIFALMGGLFLAHPVPAVLPRLQRARRPASGSPRSRPVLLVVAPLSILIVRFVGTKPVVFTGMVLIAIGLGLMSRVTVHDTYLHVLPAFLLIGIGTGLAFAPCTESVMGSLPLEQAGVGSATNGAALQTGGALGVGVLGSLLNTRYQDRLTPVLAHYRIPASILHLITGSLGGALAVAPTGRRRARRRPWQPRPAVVRERRRTSPSPSAPSSSAPPRSSWSACCPTARRAG